MTKTLMLPKPIAQTAKTVTFARADYDAIARALEDAADRGVLRAARARELSLGKNAARADAWPLELIERGIAGESPVKLWRAQRGLSARALAAAAGIGVSYLSEIENAKKPGSIAALAKIASALGVTVDDLITP